MKQTKKLISLLLTAALAVTICGCSAQSSSSQNSSASPQSSQASGSYTQNAGGFTVDNAKWSYDADNNVYYQIGVSYCSAPQDTSYETMGIYVPGSYMTGTKNSDGTYTCTVNKDGTAGSYTASDAPIVIPVNTPGYASSPAPTQYSYSSEIASCLESGLIYLQPGIRGSVRSMGGTSSTSADTSSASGGAPWGVTDIKAAIRCYRYNASTLPGDTQSVFSFGFSGGGAQSSLVGATGDSDLYTPYLETIGAAMKDSDGNTISDAVCGSMCWCPITSLDYADEAYEWNMGQFSTSGVRATDSYGSQLSKDLASTFADYINALGLKNDGTALSLSQSDSGVYQSGSYYDYMLSVINTSLNNFLADTTFPYTPSSSGGMGGMGGMNGGMRGQIPSDASMPSDASIPSGNSMPSGDSMPSDTSSSSTTYQTAQEYIDSLNADGEWITYDSSTNTASVKDIASFVENCKNANKDLGAFDNVNGTQTENKVFGDGNTVSQHFDSVLAGLLKNNAASYSSFSDWDSSLASSFDTDLAKTDSVGTSTQTRLNMYNPMYYLDDYYDGFNTSTVAKYWRIRTGIDQPDTSLTVETNLALALQNYSSDTKVDFATVWGVAHAQAERTGDSTTNFVSWVNECMGK